MALLHGECLTAAFVIRNFPARIPKLYSCWNKGNNELQSSRISPLITPHPKHQGWPNRQRGERPRRCGQAEGSPELTEDGRREKQRASSGCFASWLKLLASLRPKTPCCLFYLVSFLGHRGSILSLENELPATILETVGQDTDPNTNATDSVTQLRVGGPAVRLLSSEVSDPLNSPSQDVWV